MWGGPKFNAKYWFVYVLRDLHQPSRFKIGLSTDPEQRAKQEDRRLYGKMDGLPPFIEIMAVWHFSTFLAARITLSSQLLACSETKITRKSISDITG